MQRFSEKKLEERLTEVANSLLEPPSSRDELLRLLDQTEKLLSKVEQSPSKTMQAALSPLMIALVADKLLKHLDIDIKVGIAACISEITRITAPDCPYDDEKMKVVFQLIVSSFENLSDVSSRSYQKRATILETVAKVRSCVMLLDLECDQMIIEMFNYFLKTIRSHHDEVIVSSMETIMTLILDESEDVSPDLLKPILITLKRDNEEVISVSKNLAEAVIKNSNPKLKPYLAQAIKSLGSSAKDYSEAVAAVLGENPSVTERSNENSLKDEPENDTAESNFESKEPLSERPSKPTTSSHKKEAEAEENTTGNSSDIVSNHWPDAKSTHESVQVNVDAMTPDNSDLGRESVSISPAAVKRSGEGKSPEALQENNPVQASQTRKSTNGTKDDSIADESHSEQDSVARKQGRVNKVLPNDTAKISERDNLSEAKQPQGSGERQGSPKSNGGTRSNSEASSAGDKIGTAGKNSDGGSSLRKEDDSVKNDGNGTRDSEIGSPVRNLGDSSSKIESGSLTDQEVKKRGRGRPRKSASKEDYGNDKPSSASKGAKDTPEGTPRTRRKQTVETEKGSAEAVEYNTNLVGSKIKVWWPQDRMFYEGVVASFDSGNKKHKVLYIDGDEEILNLQKQKWELITDNAGVEPSSNDPPSDSRKKKKRGDTNPEETPSKRRRKSEVSSKNDENEAQDTKQEPDSKSKSKSSGKKPSAEAVKPPPPDSSEKKQKQGVGKSEGGSAAKMPTSDKNSDDAPPPKTTPSTNHKRGRPAKAAKLSAAAEDSSGTKAKPSSTAAKVGDIKGSSEKRKEETTVADKAAEETESKSSGKKRRR